LAASNQDQLQAALSPNYTIERELGRGGMATVYLARDMKHQRLVALKVLHADLAATLGPERFRREITTAAQLQHPHLLGVFDSGETSDGQLWFTMPYVEGQTLRQRLARTPQLPVDEVLRVMHEIASALDYAHEQGLVHRDIKPENILLSRRGDALLADFGIARALAREPGMGSTAPGLTVTGAAVGTPQYMSPEQASGERDLDARSDVYALGTVCYEMLAGEPPFSGPSVQAIVAKMLTTDAPSLRVLRPAVSPALDGAVQRALSRVPADRWPTAGEFVRAMENAERATQAAPMPPIAAVRARKRMPLAALTLGLGFVIGVGLLFAWRSKSEPASPGVSASGAVRLAVLPFENEGDSADGYFADGMTEAVHDKLTSLPGLEVVGTASSRQYRGTAKTPQQIGQELGVRYILEGRVRWAKGPGGASRVRVSPELIDANSASDKWAQPFDAPLTDVFQVQGDIAAKVAQSLQVALTPAAQQTLAARPTSDLLAYDAYLRGLAIARLGNAPVTLRRAAAAYREAVERDSMFAIAWSALGQMYSNLYFNGAPLPSIGDSAEKATARALEIAPHLAEAHAARAAYYSLVRTDNQRALLEGEKGLREGESAAILYIVSLLEESAGRWDSAVAHSAQGLSLDPRDPNTLARALQIKLWTRDIPGARSMADRALALSPGNVQMAQQRAVPELQAGDLFAARRLLAGASPQIDQRALIAFTAEYYDLGYVLDSAQDAALFAMRPDMFDSDTATWAIVQAQQYYFRGDSVRSRVYADTALKYFNVELQLTPLDDQRHTFRGLALAFLGRYDEAIAEGKRGMALRPVDRDALYGPYAVHQLARIYTLAGQPERAIDLLEGLLKKPYYLTPAWLRIDPSFKPLRGNPRFEKLAGVAKPVA
jgi:eukaryotic-like serine/threonine-protein kinase